MIVEKILNVMAKIGPIMKDKTNQEKGFDYASLANIVMKAREAMIEEKIILIPYKIEQVVQKGNDVTISMIYRFYDAEKNEKGENECIDVNIAGEGCDKEGWAIYKALSGAYKYVITQTFAIPTLDDAEKDNGLPGVTNEKIENAEDDDLNLEDSLDEENIEGIKLAEFDKVFALK